MAFKYDYIAGFDEYNRAIGQLHDELLNTAAALSAATRDPYWWVPVIAQDDAQRLVFENERLQRQLFTYKQSHEEPPLPPKIHGNAERFAKYREEVLGAALSVIIQWPDQCKNNSGKFEATKIAYLIDQKSNLYWPDTGKPSLGLEKMEREISKWINK